MSKDKLLSDEEVVQELQQIQAQAAAEHRSFQWQENKQLDLINTQKLLYAESVLDEVLVAIDKNIEASESNLKYAKDHNNSERTVANWKGCIEGEKFVKNDVIRLRAEQRARIK